MLSITRTITVDDQAFNVMLDQEAEDTFSVCLSVQPDLGDDPWDEQCYETQEQAQRAYDAINEAQVREWSANGYGDFKHFVFGA